MNKEHQYQLTTEWTGNTGRGTISYQGFERSFVIDIPGKPAIDGSSDPAFRGDRSRHNPEELLLASLSSCHMLWYLHLCSEAGIVVTGYTDDATGTMYETSNGSGRFKHATLHPSVTVSDAGMREKALLLHKKANEMCFIANSVNFPVMHQASIRHQE